MSYGVRFRFEFTDDFGTDKRVDVLQEDYSGSITEVIGSTQSPVWTSLEAQGDEKYSTLKGSLIELRVFSESNFQFLNVLSGAEEREFKLELYEDNNLKQVGFVIPESYSEPYIDTPYEASIRAVSLGALQGVPYWDDGTFYEGRVSLMTVITRCLGKLDLGLDIWDSLNTYEDQMDSASTDSPLTQADIDQSIFITEERGRTKAKSCYDVLNDVLSPFVCNLFLDSGVWKIIPSELRAGSRTVRVYNSSGVFQSSTTVNPSLTYKWLFQDQVLSTRPALREIESTYFHGLIPNLAKNGEFNEFFTPDGKTPPLFRIPVGWDTFGDFNDDIIEGAIGAGQVSVDPSDGGPLGLVLRGGGIDDGAYVFAEGVTIQVNEGDALRIKLRYAPRVLGGFAGSECQIPFMVRIGSNYLQANGGWDSTPTIIEITDIGNAFIEFLGASGFRDFELISDEIPDDGQIEVRLYKPFTNEVVADVNVAYAFFQADYYPEGFPQTESLTLVGDRTDESFAQEINYDLNIGDGPTNIHPASLTVGGSKTEDWTRGSLTGSIQRIAVNQISSEYQTQVKVIQGTLRTQGRFDGYFTEFGTSYWVISGSYDERWNRFNGQFIEALASQITVNIQEFRQQQTSQTGGVAGGGGSPVTDFDNRYYRRDLLLSETPSVDLPELRDNIDVYSRDEVDAPLIKLRLADDSLMQRKAEAGLNIQAGDGLSGGGLLTDDISLNVEVDDSTIEIDGDLRVKDEGITEAKLADDSVSTDKIIDDNVTNAKLANSTISGKELGTNLDSLSAGNGLTGTDYNGSTPRTFAVGTPSTLTVSSTNSTTSTSHNHALDLSGRTLTLADDSDGVITFPANAQNLGDNRTWTPTLASHGDDQRGTLDPTVQDIYGDKTFLDDVYYDSLIESDSFLDVEDIYTGVQLSQEGIKAETIRANELRVKAFIAEISAALYGEDILTKSRGVLSRDFVIPAVSGTATLFVEDLEGFVGVQVFEDNDFVRMRVIDRSGGLVVADVWGNVTGYNDEGDGEQSWTFTRITGGTADTGDVVYAGSIAIDYGQSGDGVIVRSVIGDNTPRDTQLTWVTSPIDPANYTIITRVGNLGGIPETSGYGFYGENTFLTGSLLVGDLTKVGNYLEYDGSELNVFANEINLTAIGDVGSSVLTLQSDLIDLFLREESSYAGIQFLAGQLILSASDIDGQGRVKLAEVRLDATGEESLVGISADAFLLETNNLLIDSEAANNGKIALGSNPTGITVANTVAGTILDGDGNAKFYTNANNFLRKGASSIELRSTNAIIQGGDLLIEGTSSPKIQIADTFRKLTLDSGTSFPTIQTRDSGSDSSSPFAVGGSWDSDILLQSLFLGDIIRLVLDVEYASSGGAETQEFEVTVFEFDGGGNNVLYSFRDTITGSSGSPGEKNYDIEFPSTLSGTYIGSEGVFVRVDSIGSGTGNFEVTDAELIHYNSETYINKGGFRVQKSPNTFISNNRIRGSFALNLPIIEDTSTPEAIFLALSQYQGQAVMVRNQIEDPNDPSFGIPYYQVYQVGEYGAI